MNRWERIPVQVEAVGVVRVGILAALRRDPFVEVVERNGEVIVIAGLEGWVGRVIESWEQASMSVPIVVLVPDQRNRVRAERLGVFRAVRLEEAPEVLPALIHEARSAARGGWRSPQDLTPAGGGGHGGSRERAVLVLAVRGLSNCEIAEALDLDVQTVKNYLQRAFDRYGVSGRSELVMRIGSPGANRSESSAAVLRRRRPTERQITILAEVLSQGSARAAADRLGLSTRTVESHLSNLRARCGAGSLAQLTRVAIEEGWLESTAV